MTGRETISSRAAEEISCLALRRAGAPADHAKLQVEFLLEAELRGRASHGLLRLPRLVERIHNGVIDPGTRGSSSWSGDAVLQVDGRRGLGPVVACEALQTISARAKTSGVSVAAIRNSNHIGMLALYAEKIASRGQILIALTTSEALVHPWGGRRAMIGTNPIAIGVPADPAPFVLDMATSLISMGQVHDYANRGQPLEPGWALDGDGEPTSDAAAARDGAIAPFGGAKGYALGLSFELLVTALTGSAIGREVAGTLDSVQTCNKGDVFIVAEPASTAVTRSISAYLADLRSSPPADPAKPIRVPGDRAQIQRDKSLRDGIGISSEIWSTIRDLAGQAP